MTKEEVEETVENLKYKKINKTFFKKKIDGAKACYNNFYAKF